MLDMIHFIVTVLSDHPSFEWECYRSADLVLSVKVNLFDMFPCCCCSVWHGRDARDGDWRRWLSSSNVTFLQKLQGLVKGTATLCRLCALYCYWLFWNVYGYIGPRPKKKPLTIWDLQNTKAFVNCNNNNSQYSRFYFISDQLNAAKRLLHYYFFIK